MSKKVVEDLVVRGTLTLASGDSFLSNIVEDTTPQLGGNLDVNGNSIVSASNGDITLAPNGSGEIVVTSGINFPDTQSASSDPNTLDDYEEGSATGTVKFADAASGGNESVSTVETYYTKIGRCVHIMMRIDNLDTTGLTAGNTAYITGLPFSGYSSSRQKVGPIYTTATTYDSTSIYANIDVSSDVIKLVHAGAGAEADVVISDFTDDSSDIYLNFLYFV